MSFGEDQIKQLVRMHKAARGRKKEILETKKGLRVVRVRDGKKVK
jgi:hypothetical protein